MLALSSFGVEKARIQRMTERDKQVAYLIYPESQFKFAWQIFVTIMIIITCVLTPLQLCDFVQYVWINHIIDIIFLVDMIVIFNSAILTEDYETIEDRGEIACEYLKGWFWVDLISILPLDLILSSGNSNN